MSRSVSGGYVIGTISLKNTEDVPVLSHEVSHYLSDHGIIVGTVNGYGLGYALNEEINSSVNFKYYVRDISYTEQKTDVFYLSLIIGNEAIINSYLNGNIDIIINAIVKIVLEYLKRKYMSIFIVWI